jgi:hypothetical protein
MMKAQVQHFPAHVHPTGFGREFEVFPWGSTSVHYDDRQGDQCFIDIGAAPVSTNERVTLPTYVDHSPEAMEFELIQPCILYRYIMKL